MISCITVTRNRTDYLVNCINYYIGQTYQDKELIIVYYNTDTHTEKYLKAQSERLKLNNIKIFKFIEDKGMFLGAARNFAVNKASGDWICIWDDDDYFAPTRLENQLNFCLNNDLDGCSLEALILYSEKNMETRLSPSRITGWEGSLLVKRKEMTKYINTKKGEDTPVLESLFDKKKMGLLVDPELYIYVFHESNTSSSRHKENLFDRSSELSLTKNRELLNKIL